MRRVVVVAALIVVAYGAHVQMRSPAPQPLRPAAAAMTAQSAVLRGRGVYERYGCTACHGADGKGGFANANAETEGKVPGVNYVAEGFTRAELRRKILDGFATVGRKDPNGPRPPYRMPGWANQMADADVADLVEYLW